MDPILAWETIEPMNPDSFASALLAHLRQLDPRAQALKKGPRWGGAVVVGIDDDGFQPLLRVSGGSGKFNVMSLFVRHHRNWAPTFQRGTPAALAEQLAGPLQHLWTIPLSMAEAFSVETESAQQRPPSGIGELEGAQVPDKEEIGSGFVGEKRHEPP